VAHGSWSGSTDPSRRPRRCVGLPLKPAARDAELDVIHAWGLPLALAAAPFAPVPDLAVLEKAGRQVLEEALADPALDGVRARGHLVAAGAAGALLDAAEGAGLVVVGAQGGGLAAALLGSVTRKVLHHGPCPVAVIPDGRR
jgi:nucleotide-binding universal stress UspA family protein